ncbi:MAG: hypothetical protein IAE63_00055 [Alphaproteobacteria bacterium]|nr:hypothetical protein [Alphaproteobacteria bacterium]
MRVWEPKDGLKGQFRKPEQQSVKQEDFIKKTKAEAEKKRQDMVHFFLAFWMPA